MARPGRPRTPSHLALIHGGKSSGPEARGADGRCGSSTAGGRPCSRATGGGPCWQHAESSGLPPPDHLTARGRAAWHRIAPELERLRLLSVLDVPALAHLCEKEAVAGEAWEELVEHGLVVKGAKGPKKNPAWQIYREATAELRLLYKEFGLTPSSRAAFELPEEREPSKMENLLRERPD